MEAYQAVLVAVVALLVGVLLPVLFQLALTLRAVRAAVAQAGPALASITATAERVERLTAKFEEGGRIEHALAAMDSASSAAAKLQETARLASTIGAALIPAAAAAVKAWRDGREPDEPRSSGEAASQPPPAVRVAP
jgi:hypothetical protein